MIYTLYSERFHAGHELMTICIYSIWEQNPTSLPWTRPAASPWYIHPSIHKTPRISRSTELVVLAQVSFRLVRDIGLGGLGYRKGKLVT